MHLPSRLGSLPCINTPISSPPPLTPRHLCCSFWPGCQPHLCNGPHQCYGRRARLLRAPQTPNRSSKGIPAVWALHRTLANDQLPACAGSHLLSTESKCRICTVHRRTSRMATRACSEPGRQEEGENSHQWVHAQVAERSEEESLGSDDDDDTAYPSLQAVQDSRHQAGESHDGQDTFCVVNFYHLTDVAEPSETLRAHRY